MDSPGHNAVLPLLHQRVRPVLAPEVLCRPHQGGEGPVAGGGAAEGEAAPMQVPAQREKPNVL